MRYKFTRAPSEYFREIYYDGITYQLDAFQQLIGFAGADRVLFGTDYPHMMDIPGIVGRIDTLPPDQSDAVRAGNAERIFDL